MTHELLTITLSVSAHFYILQKTNKPANTEFAGLLTSFDQLISGLSLQEIEPNAGIIEEDLYFKAFIKQKLDIRIERRKFKNSK